MSSDCAASFARDDIVRVLPHAPPECRPGERARIVGINVQHKPSDGNLERHPDDIVYTIAFDDGSHAAIEEHFLLREILLEAHRWSTEEDFYTDLLAELKAPVWHGHNLDAFWDSIVEGGINGIEPPFAITIRGKAIGDEAQRVVELFTELIHEAAEKGCAVSMVAES